MRRCLIHGVFLVVLVLAIGRSALTSAQDATPAMSGGLPVTPDPSECTAPEITFDEIMERAGTPTGAVTGSPVSAETFELPDGEPADSAVVDAVTATLREVVACINTGNFLTIFNFTTDRFLQQLLASEEEGEEAPPEGTAEMGTVSPKLYASLNAIHDVVMLPDGRVGALVETVFPDEMPGVQVDYFYFVEQQGRWLLDGIVEDLEGRFPPVSGTPAAE